MVREWVNSSDPNSKGVSGDQPDKQPGIKKGQDLTWAVFKTLVGCLIKGIIILPNYIRILICQYKDPYKPISTMECHKAFERCSHESPQTFFFSLHLSGLKKSGRLKAMTARTKRWDGLNKKRQQKNAKQRNTHVFGHCFWVGGPCLYGYCFQVMGIFGYSNVAHPIF